ncbi:hypothetical protein scyTo_0013382, partial [Scyliorhinus torazame]|nr:hypothetical protein [Scyliorhinus torazame]
LREELEAMTRYTSPVNPAVFPHLTVVLLAIGMFFTAWFFVYEVTSTKYTRDIYKDWECAGKKYEGPFHQEVLFPHHCNLNITSSSRSSTSSRDTE